MRVYQVFYSLNGEVHIQADNPEQAREIACLVVQKQKENPDILLELSTDIWDVTKDDELEIEYKRVCNACKQGMVEGYCIDDGLAYYCSEECLHEEYTPEEYEEMYEDDYAYWTQWEE
ncbi:MULTISPECIES: hypothetical protein [Bacillus cereus group]|uniref:Uncharacterized protein n=1 Tax=Bacillus thuringiensis TaxID=1428 RepID=A0A1C4GN73_BACTU|nr:MULTISPECIES: hypothetical protein [Bacillus cereus group]MCU5097055.1 hypothetical protein [Bacillus wiedmannii]MED3026118.1 hypothetical protein [Bacillus wiedmannii]OTY03913.1 hypothetical protein BK729_05580 [Bacillus thuringiensis serovar wratislaviensis]SCC69596.1 Uncharacterized protein BTT61001_06285 [Bacillus thuringiensis]